MHPWLVSFLKATAAVVAGLAAGSGVFYVVFFAPSWFVDYDILLGWGWIGVPLGFVLGVWAAIVVGGLAHKRMTRKDTIS